MPFCVNIQWLVLFVALGIAKVTTLTREGDDGTKKVSLLVIFLYFFQEMLRALYITGFAEHRDIVTATTYYTYEVHVEVDSRDDTNEKNPFATNEIIVKRRFSEFLQLAKDLEEAELLPGECHLPPKFWTMRRGPELAASRTEALQRDFLRPLLEAVQANPATIRNLHLRQFLGLVSYQEPRLADSPSKKQTKPQLQLADEMMETLQAVLKRTHMPHRREPSRQESWQHARHAQRVIHDLDSTLTGLQAEEMDKADRENFDRLRFLLTAAKNELGPWISESVLYHEDEQLVDDGSRDPTILDDSTQSILDDLTGSPEANVKSQHPHPSSAPATSPDDPSKSSLLLERQNKALERQDLQLERISLALRRQQLLGQTIDEAVREESARLDLLAHRISETKSALDRSNDRVQKL